MFIAITKVFSQEFVDLQNIDDAVYLAPVADVQVSNEIKMIDLKLKNNVPWADKASIGATVKTLPNNKSELSLINIKAGDKAMDLSQFDLKGEIPDNKMKANQAVKLPISSDVIKNLLAELLGQNKVNFESNLPTQSAPNQGSSGIQSSDGNGPAAAITPLAPIFSKKTTYKISTDGCITRIDYSQTKAIVQTKLITLEDGNEVNVEECKDSGISYPLVKQFNGCPDLINQAGGYANPRFKWQYFNSSGSAILVGECTTDSDKQFKIIEDLTCGVDIDKSTGKVWVKSKKTYNDINGNPVIISDCSRSQESVPLTSTACTLKTGFPDPNQSIGFKKTYIYQGSDFYMNRVR